jgi:hypothetical protein
LTPALVGIPSIIPDEMLSSVGDVLGNFGQEIQGVEHLEIARGAGGQFLVAGSGKRLTVLCSVL